MQLRNPAMQLPHAPTQLPNFDVATTCFCAATQLGAAPGTGRRRRPLRRFSADVAVPPPYPAMQPHRVPVQLPVSASRCRSSRLLFADIGRHFGMADPVRRLLGPPFFVGGSPFRLLRRLRSLTSARPRFSLGVSARGPSGRPGVRDYPTAWKARGDAALGPGG